MIFIYNSSNVDNNIQIKIIIIIIIIIKINLIIYFTPIVINLTNMDKFFCFLIKELFWLYSQKSIKLDFNRYIYVCVYIQRNSKK